MISNPFLELREKRGWSQNECARIIGVDVRAIARLEHGLYTSPLPSAVNYWHQNSTQSIPEILSAYEDFVYATRRANHRHFNHLHVDISSGIHPWRVIRSNSFFDATTTHRLSLTECARLMCVPLDTLQYWEKKWRTQHSVPKSILLALNQMGYTQVELTKFQEVYQAWREIHLKDPKPKQPRRRQIKVTS